MYASILEETAITRVRPPRPSEITANVPADMPGHYLRRIIERASEDTISLIESIEDTLDAELAAERWRSMDDEGSVPWEDVKKELGLD